MVHFFIFCRFLNWYDDGLPISLWYLPVELFISCWCWPPYLITFASGQVHLMSISVEIFHSVLEVMMWWMAISQKMGQLIDKSLEMKWNPVLCNMHFWYIGKRNFGGDIFVWVGWLKVRVMERARWRKMYLICNRKDSEMQR